MKKQKQALLVLIFAILSWADISAQLLIQDVVYLNNGTVVHGKIISNNIDSVRIESCCHNIFVFPAADIQKMTQEEQKVSNKEFRENFVPGNHKGIYSYTTLGMLIGKTESNNAENLSFQTSAGYQFNNYLALGAGIGIETLKTQIMPVFISFKSNFLERSNSPTCIFQIGYSFPLSTVKESEDIYNNSSYNYKGGLNVGFDIGVHSFKSQNRAFTITLGYRYQVVKETHDNYYWYGNRTEKNTYEFNRIAIKFGFMFI